MRNICHVHRVVLVQPVERHARRDQAGDDVAERMDPVVDGRVGEPGVGVDVIAPLRVDHRLAREVRGEQARHAVGRAGVVEHVGGGMAFGEIERTARTQQCRDDLRPRAMSGSQQMAPQVTNTMSNRWGGGIASSAS